MLLHFFVLRTLIVVGALVSLGCKTRADGPESSDVAGAGRETILVNTSAHHFAGKDGFHFQATELDFSNAYWLAAITEHAHTRSDVALKAMETYGFRNSNDPASPDHLMFLDKKSKEELEFFITKIPKADTQAIWAESKDGVILAFRGTESKEPSDFVTDLLKFKLPLANVKMDSLGPSASSGVVADPAEGAMSFGEIRVHYGFRVALDAVWSDLETRAQQIYLNDASDRRQRIERMAKLLAAGNTSALEGELAQTAAWNIPRDGKLTFLKNWNQANSSKKDLLNVAAMMWAGKPLWLTGFSLGAGVATLAAYRFMKMGLNVKGLYTYGSPRVGNAAFRNDFRVLAFKKGLKHPGSEGGLARFVNHRDIVTRVAPVFGWHSAWDDSSLTKFAQEWNHVSHEYYITGESETKRLGIATEFWDGTSLRCADKFKDSNIPYTVKLPLAEWRSAIGDHSIVKYAAKLETLAFSSAVRCL